MLVYLLITLLLYSIKAQIIIENKDIYLTQGIVRGEVKYVAGKSVNIFLGIPYAEPPIDSLRFRAPLKHSGWQVFFLGPCSKNNFFKNLIKKIEYFLPQIYF